MGGLHQPGSDLQVVDLIYLDVPLEVRINGK